MAIFGVVAGILVDRIGPRWTIIIGGIIGGLGMAALSKTSSMWYFYLLFGFITPMGISLSYMVAPVSTVRRWFMKKAALTGGITMTGSGLGIVILVPVAHAMIANWNWRTGYIAFSIFLAAGTFVGGSLMRKDPESYGTYPDGMQTNPEEMKIRADFIARDEKWAVRETMQNRNWWYLILAQLGYLLAVMGLLAHVIMWGLDIGLPLKSAVSTMSVFVLAAVIGRVFGGFFSDWYMNKFPEMSRKLILYVCLLGVAFGLILAAIIVDSYGTLLCTVMIIGFCYGSGMAVFPTYLGDLFGVVNVPTLFGVMGLFIASFSAMGPIIYGFSFDTTGSYTHAFLINTVLCLLSTVALYLIEQPKKP